MHVHFHGPYPLCSEDVDILDGCPYAGSAGIYLWTVQSASLGFVVDYVGETSKTFYARTKEHLIQALGGNYLVLDPGDLTDLHETVLWQGLWRRGTRDRMPRFLAQYEVLAPRIKGYLALHQVFVAPLACDRTLRRRIEGALAAAFRAATPSLLPRDIRYRVRSSSEPGIGVRVSADRLIAGLPATLDA